MKDYRITLKASDKASDGFVYFTRTALQNLPLEPLDCLLDGPKVLMVKHARNMSNGSPKLVGYISKADFQALFGVVRGIKAYPVVVKL